MSPASDAPAGRSFVDDVDASLTCAVCRMPYASPVIFPCGNGHVFCLECVESWTLASRARRRADVACPMCRRSARESVAVMRLDEDTAARLRATWVGCGCGARVRLDAAATHHARCELTRALVRPRRGIETMVRRLGGGGARAGSDAGTLGDSDDDDEVGLGDGDGEYACLMCVAKYARTFYDRDDLQGEPYDGDVLYHLVNAMMDDLPDDGTIFHDGMTNFANHILETHDDEEGHGSAVCPICASLPHGDPTLRVHDLYDHISRRHSFDWTLYMPDISASEYETLAFAMRESLVSAGLSSETNE